MAAPSEIWVREVYDATGKHVGPVERLAFRHGEARRIVVRIDGRLRVYPVEQVRMVADRIILPVEPGPGELQVVH